MRDWLRISAGWWVLVLGLLATPARANDVADEADLHFRLGAERYTAGDFRGALEHFLASNRLVANRNVVFNIARAYEKLQRYPEAFRYYDAALAAEADPAVRQTIEAALAQLRPHVAVLDIRTEPPGATLYIDRRDLGPRGKSPRALGLAEGSYKVIAELAGHYPAELDVAGARVGTVVPVRLTLAPILGTLRIEGTVGATARIDGAAHAQCAVPCSVELPPGRHTLRVALAGHRSAELFTEVNARTETVVPVRLEQRTGTAVIETDEPGALVEIDGRESGFTPVVLSLPVGEHRLRISARGYRASERELLVDENRQSRVEAVLIRAEEVASASRVTESVEDAPSSVTIIPREELVAFGYPDDRGRGPRRARHLHLVRSLVPGDRLARTRNAQQLRQPRAGAVRRPSDQRQLDRLRLRRIRRAHRPGRPRTDRGRARSGFGALRHQRLLRRDQRDHALRARAAARRARDFRPVHDGRRTRAGARAGPR